MKPYLANENINSTMNQFKTRKRKYFERWKKRMRTGHDWFGLTAERLRNLVVDCFVVVFC